MRPYKPVAKQSHHYIILTEHWNTMKSKLYFFSGVNSGIFFVICSCNNQ